VHAPPADVEAGQASFGGPLALVVTEIIGKTKFDAYRE